MYSRSMDIIDATYARHNTNDFCRCPSCQITRHLRQMDALIARSREQLNRMEDRRTATEPRRQLRTDGRINRGRRYTDTPNGQTR